MSKILKAALPTGDGPPKAAPAPGPRQAKVIDRRVLLAHGEARRLLEGAEARAHGIVADAEARARDLVAEARDQGFAEGLARFEDGLTELAEARARVLDEARPRAVELATKVAEKILRQRLAADPAALVPVVEEALGALQGGGAVTVRIHPTKAPSLVERRRRLLEREPRWSRLDIVADDGIDEDGCILESELGSLDAGVLQQLRALERLLRRASR
ncbi:MAG: type III secretion system stator protein SctL [Acidobacteriota bacterium]